MLIWKEQVWIRKRESKGACTEFTVQEKRQVILFLSRVRSRVFSASPSRVSTRGLKKAYSIMSAEGSQHGMHFTACKAIISIFLFSPRPTFWVWGCWVSSPSYGERLPQPRRYWFAFIHKGRGMKCSQTSQTKFAVLHSREDLWAFDWVGGLALPTYTHTGSHMCV